MDLECIINSIRVKKSFLCVGLDPDMDLIPSHLMEEKDPVFSFNKSIIDATKDLCVAYKPNLAFYEKLGPEGFVSLKKTLDYIPDDHFVIADAKRSDIFNSAKMYADTFYNYFNFDAVTVSPYMGKDAVSPFVRSNKWAVLLISTSNNSASEIQNTITETGDPLYLDLVKKSMSWYNEKQIMFVVGATRISEMNTIRKKAPNHFFLVPGIGFQGGDFDAVCYNGFNDACGLLINISRSILYAESGVNFSNAAHHIALDIQQKMAQVLKDKKII